MRLRGVACACGEKDLVSVSPGDAPVMAPGNFPLVAGKPLIGWCLVCAPWLRGYKPDAKEAVEC